MSIVSKFTNSVKSRILSLAEFPSECADHISVMEIMNGNEAYISGCERIIEYTDTEIILKLKLHKIRLCGYGLILSDFTGGIIRIDGTIIEIQYDKEE